MHDKNNFKIIASVIAIIVILGFMISVVYNTITGKKNSFFDFETSKTEEIKYEYFRLYSQTGVGVIDKKGNIIIEPSYNEICIPNQSEDVFFCFSTENEYKILDKDLNEIFTEFEDVSTIEIKNIESEFEKKVLKYKKDELYGLINYNGKILTDAIYNGISSVKDRPGMLLVKKDGNYGVLDSDGKVLIDCIYDKINADGYCSEKFLYAKTGYIVSKKDENGINYGYIDYNGNLALDLIYESVKRVLNSGDDKVFLIVMQNGKKGVIGNNEEIIDLNFQDIEYTSNIFVVNKNGKYGFYLDNGKMILGPQYTKYLIAGEYISVEDGNETKLFDINGNLINTNSYRQMIEVEKSDYFIAQNNDGYYSIISKEVNISKDFLSVSFAFDTYFIVEAKDGKFGIIDILANDYEIKPKYDFIFKINNTNTLALLDYENNKVIVYSKEMKETVDMTGGKIETLPNGYAVIYSDEDIVYINSNGNVVSNTEVYKDKKMYSIKQNDKWGFADLKGNIVINCEYDIVTELNEYGFAGIKKDNKWGVVDENGKIIVEPSYEIDAYYFPKFIGKYLLQEYEIVYCEELDELKPIEEVTEPDENIEQEDETLPEVVKEKIGA